MAGGSRQPLVAGLDTRAITDRLFISRHTVQDHLKSIFEKVGVHSRRELLVTLNAQPPYVRHSRPHLPDPPHLDNAERGR
jgi:hypothetical protein